MSRCARCKRSAFEESITLHRINPLGENGIFICQEYCGAITDDDVIQDIVNVIREEEARAALTQANATDESEGV